MHIYIAHPTEVNRRTLILKHQKVIELLEQLDRKDLIKYEYRQTLRELKSQISSIWESDDLRRSKPTPLDEAK